MNGSDMKRKIAAVLSMAIISGCLPFAALAEGQTEATPSEPLPVLENVTQAAPPTAQIEQLEAQIEKAPENVVQTANDVMPIDDTTTVANVFSGANITPYNASKDNVDDGGVEGTVSFTGDSNLYVELCKDSGGSLSVVKATTLTKDNKSFHFGGIYAGTYQLRFQFAGESELASKARVEVGYDAVSAPEPETQNIFYSASASTRNVSADGAKDGEVYGSAEFAGDKKLYAKLYKAADTSNQIAHYGISQSGGSYSFTGLEPGDYVVKFFFDGEGSLPAQDEKYVTVSMDVSAGTTYYDPIQASVSVSSDTITVELTDATEGERLWVYVGNDAREIAKGTPVSFSGLAAGNYTVRINYEALGVGHSEYSFAQTVTLGAPSGTDSQYLPILASVSSTNDSITVNVTQATDGEKLQATLNGSAPVEIAKGTPYTFEGLANGTYDVSINYAATGTGQAPFYQTVKLENSAATPTPTPAPTPTPTPTPAPVVLGEIKIAAVTAGTNLLTVSGTATAGQQLIITTEPAAAADAYAVANDQGVFSVQISCAAGTYTAVTARYVTDATIAGKATGSWTVAAPATKPTLTVDAVDATSTTVVGKTTAGIVVELKTSDYAQKVTADENGIVRFSLPHTYGAGTKMTLVVYYGSSQSFTQEITVANAVYLGTLEYGDTGDAVEKLTARLAELGYPVSKTNRYGSTVREAVRLFQRANGIDDDGIAGPKTQQALFSVGAIAYGTDQYPTLVRGDRGYQLIYTLQQRLKDLGYYTIKVDGIFGSGTQRAVRLFQQVNGLSVTGKADNATQTLLYSSAAKPAGYGVSGEYKTLSRSSKYKSAVVPLQRRLKALGYYSGNIDGYFGSQTYRAVRNFQSRNGLTVTGVADPYTQQVLYSSSARKASGSSSSSSSSTSSTGYRLLYWGCRGDAVKRLQNALISAGYKSIVRTADGIYGQWTYDAVRAYQKDHGLSVDGIAGKNTQNALYGTSY